MGKEGLLKEIKGEVVGIDTMSFIYAFEEHPTYLHIVRPLFEWVEKGEVNGITSTVTAAECLVKPYEAGDISLLAKYKMLFRNFPNMKVIPVTFEISEKAAELRALHKIRTPDAIQIAACLLNGARTFVTNDSSLSKAEGMSVVQLDDFLD